MGNIKIRQTAFPLITAFIWGTAFVAQSIAAKQLGPFTFNAVRSLFASISLLLVCIILWARGKKKGEPFRPSARRRDLLIGGAACGIALTVASNLQQSGLSETSAGKAGFITALYIVLVPIFGIFLKKKTTVIVWIAVAIATAGLYLLCVKENFTVSMGDARLLLCAVAFTVHILVVDYFVQRVDGIALSCVQFCVVTVCSAGGMLLFEEPSMGAIVSCIVPILYVGVFSGAIAYTLQILAQKGTNPTVVSILLSMESVISVISGAILLKERLLEREYVGCVLMFGAVLLTQIPAKKKSSALSESSSAVQ